MNAVAERKPLGQLLLSRGLLRPEQLQTALEEQKKANHQKLLGEVLIDLKFCTEEQIAETLAQAYGVPFARISPKIADPRAVSTLPKEFLERHQILPLFLIESVLTVAVPEPANVFLIEEIERLSGFPVQVVAATARDILTTLQSYLPDKNVFVIDGSLDIGDVSQLVFTEDQIEDARLHESAVDSPVVRLVNHCLGMGVREGASDIHIEPGDHNLRIRFRMDGLLTEKLTPPFQMHAAIAARLKLMAGLDVADHQLPQEGCIRIKVEKRPVELRLSTMPGRWGEKIVIRIVDSDRTVVNLERLGFNYDTLKEWRRLIAQPHGILLATGPNGSGKSATLYATLAELNTPRINICTIEDPIEHSIPGVNQFQVGQKGGLGYDQTLRALLKQDPDVVMIGELVDPETARTAAQAALTGHLILSTLHTNDSLSALTRLANLGVEPYLAGATIAGVLAQRLVRKLCQSCRETYEPSMAEKRQLERLAGPVEKLYRAKGCPRCRNTGFSGRIGLYELLSPDDRLLELISAGAGMAALREHAGQMGLKTLRMDGIEKVKAGITTLEEVIHVTV